MKKFWKIVFGSALGYVIAGLVLTILTFGIFASLAGSGSSTGKTYVPANAVLDIDFSTLRIAEQTLPDDPFASLSSANSMMEPVKTIGILDAVRAIEAAAGDSSIKCIYLRPDAATGIAHLEEFRAALDKFRSSGKTIVTFIQTPTNAGYYIGSVADRIYIADYHGGMNMLIGISGQMTFYKDLFDKLGVNMQLIRHGKYKSAGEGFIRNSPSPENLEQNSVMVKSIWDELSSAMAERCGRSKAEFNAIIDNLELVDAGDFVAKGLADEAVSLDGMKEKLRVLTGCEKFEDVQSICLADYAALKVLPNYRAKEKIAIIYADGDIIDGRDLQNVAGKRFADIINDVRCDSSVKAVVLRVNSPGGSVVASTQIKEELDRLGKDKPIVASYGAYAASGGYWISACSKYIFSDATTLTGSIGVFGLVPDLSKAVRDIAHLNIVAVPSNKHSDMFSGMRPLSGAETAYMQKDIEKIYSDFTSLVAAGRGKSVEEVDALGQGRVWTGRDALERGLVDQIGGLSQALDYASALVNCPDYQVASYPEALSPMEQAFSAFNRSNEESPLVKIAKQVKKTSESGIYARLPFDIEMR